MPNVKISELPAATSIALSDIAPLVQGGITKRTPFYLPPYHQVVNARSHGATGDGSTNDRAALQAAIDEAYSTGRRYVYLPYVTSPITYYNISTPLYLWGAAHYWLTDNGIVLFGDGPSTVIRKTTNSGTGDGSAYASTDAVILFTPHDKLVASSAFNCGLVNLRLTSTSASTFGAVALGPLARLNIDSVIIDAVGTAFNVQNTMYLSTIRRLHTNTTAYGIKMDTTGTSNHLDDCFVTATATVAYLLRGVYSTGTSLAADSNTGVVYQFAGDWVINGLGSESTSGTKIIELLSGGLPRVVVNNPYIQPQNDAAKTVFVVNQGALIVNGGFVGSNSSPQALAGQLASNTAGTSVTPYQGLFLNDVRIGDTYAVASTGAIMQSGGSSKFGRVTVPTGVATTIYTLVNEEAGIIIAYGTGDNGNIYAVGYAGIAGGNPGFASIASASLTMTRSGANIQIQHALGSDYAVGYKFLRFGDGNPVTW